MSLIDTLRRCVLRCEPGDRGDLLAFRQAMFGGDARQADPGHVAWLFDHNPFEHAHAPGLWIFRRNGGVVGHQAGIAIDLKVDEGYRRASWAVDLMVEPAWRLRGAGPLLIDAHAKAAPIALALGISDAAQKAYRKGGWIDVGGIPNYLWPLRPDQLLALGPLPHRTLIALGRLVRPLTIGAAAAVALIATRGTRLEPIERFDARVDAVWSAAARHHRVIARRDFKALHWRFDALPDAPAHHRHYLVRDGRVLGYAVLRFDRLEGRTLALLVDYLVEPGDFAALFGHCLRLARVEGACGLLCKTLNAGADTTLRALGFLRLSRRPFWPTRMMARIATDDPPLAAALGDGRNWFVTMADSDIGLDHLQDRRRSP